MLFRKVIRTPGSREQRMTCALHHRGSRQGWLTMGVGQREGKTGEGDVESPLTARQGGSPPFPSLPGKLGHDLICKGGEAGIVACHISNKEYTTKGQRTRGFVRIQRWERFI